MRSVSAGPQRGAPRCAALPRGWLSPGCCSSSLLCWWWGRSQGLGDHNAWLQLPLGQCSYLQEERKDQNESGFTPKQDLSKAAWSYLQAHALVSFPPVLCLNSVIVKGCDMYKAQIAADYSYNSAQHNEPPAFDPCATALSSRCVRLLADLLRKYWCAASFGSSLAKKAIANKNGFQGSWASFLTHNESAGINIQTSMVMEGIIAGEIVWIMALSFLLHCWEGIYDYHP